MKHTGIVLRHYEPRKKKMAILDRRLGLLNVIPSFAYAYRCNDTISAGTVISYDLIQRGRLHIVQLAQVLDVPLNLAKENISFFHHLLELCSLFIPENSQDHAGVFDLLLYLYTHIEHAVLPLQAKLVLCKFFSLVGVQPEHELFDQAFFAWVHVSQMAQVLSVTITQDNERMLDLWLIHCVNAHPMVGSIKTIGFLDEVRV